MSVGVWRCFLKFTQAKFYSNLPASLLLLKMSIVEYCLKFIHLEYIHLKTLITIVLFIIPISAKENSSQKLLWCQ